MLIFSGVGCENHQIFCFESLKGTRFFLLVFFCFFGKNEVPSFLPNNFGIVGGFIFLIFWLQIIGENDSQFGKYLCRWICALIYYVVIFSTTGPKNILKLSNFNDQLDVFFA